MSFQFIMPASYTAAIKYRIETGTENEMSQKVNVLLIYDID